MAKKKVINANIILYGPSTSGKTSNLQFIHRKLRPSQRGKIQEMSQDGYPEVAYEFLPIELGELRGYDTNLYIYTAPTHRDGLETRLNLLNEAAGVVFIVDSDASRLDDNIESLTTLKDELSYWDLDYDTFPIIFQYNKRDLSNAMSIEDIERELNPEGKDSFEAVGNAGQGVRDTFALISKMAVRRVRLKLATEDTSSGPATDGDPVTLNDEVKTGIKISGVKTRASEQTVEVEPPQRPDAEAGQESHQQDAVGDAAPDDAIKRNEEVEEIALDEGEGAQVVQEMVQEKATPDEDESDAGLAATTSEPARSDEEAGKLETADDPAANAVQVVSADHEEEAVKVPKDRRKRKRSNKRKRKEDVPVESAASDQAEGKEEAAPARETAADPPRETAADPPRETADDPPRETADDPPRETADDPPDSRDSFLKTSISFGDDEPMLVEAGEEEILMAVGEEFEDEDEGVDSAPSFSEAVPDGLGSISLQDSPSISSMTLGSIGDSEVNIHTYADEDEEDEPIFRLGSSFEDEDDVDDLQLEDDLLLDEEFEGEEDLEELSSSQSLPENDVIPEMAIEDVEDMEPVSPVDADLQGEGSEALGRLEGAGDDPSARTSEEEPLAPGTLDEDTEDSDDELDISDETAKVDLNALSEPESSEDDQTSDEDEDDDSIIASREALEESGVGEIGTPEVPPMMVGVVGAEGIEVSVVIDDDDADDEAVSAVGDLEQSEDAAAEPSTTAEQDEAQREEQDAAQDEAQREEKDEAQREEKDEAFNEDMVVVEFPESEGTAAEVAASEESLSDELPVASISPLEESPPEDLTEKEPSDIEGADQDSSDKETSPGTEQESAGEEIEELSADAIAQASSQVVSDGSAEGIERTGEDEEIEELDAGEALIPDGRFEDDKPTVEAWGEAQRLDAQTLVLPVSVKIPGIEIPLELSVTLRVDLLVEELVMTDPSK